MPRLIPDREMWRFFYVARKLTDTNYSDDVAITTNTINNATVLLHHLENYTNVVELYVNKSKIELISFN